MTIACSLNPTEMTSRLADVRALGHDALLTVNQRGNRAQLRFGAGAGVRERIEQIVAAESGCCPFLAMGVSDAPGAVVLTIDAPDGAEPVLRELAEAFQAE